MLILFLPDTACIESVWGQRELCKVAIRSSVALWASRTAWVCTCLYMYSVYSNFLSSLGASSSLLEKPAEEHSSNPSRACGICVEVLLWLLFSWRQVLPVALVWSNALLPRFWVEHAAFPPALACHVYNAIAPRGRFSDPHCLELEDGDTGRFVFSVVSLLVFAHITCICSVKTQTLI